MRWPRPAGARVSSGPSTTGGAGNGRDLPYVPDGPIRSSQFHYVWPNRTLNTFPGPANSRVLVFEPVGPERTRTYVDGFWAPGTPDGVIAEITEFGAVVGQEDVDLVESVHRGLRSRCRRPGPAAARQRALAAAFPAARPRRTRRVVMPLAGDAGEDGSRTAAGRQPASMRPAAERGVASCAPGRPRQCDAADRQRSHCRCENQFQHAPFLSPPGVRPLRVSAAVR